MAINRYRIPPEVIDELKTDFINFGGDMKLSLENAVTHTITALLLGNVIRRTPAGTYSALIILLLRGVLFYRTSYAQNFGSALFKEITRDKQAGGEYAVVLAHGITLLLYIASSIFGHKPLMVITGFLWIIVLPSIVIATSSVFVMIYYFIFVEMPIDKLIALFWDVFILPLRVSVMAYSVLASRYRKFRQAVISGSLFMSTVAFNGASKYDFDPIDREREIRILELRPGLFGIRCDIVPLSLDDANPYDAMSYTWGEPNKTHILNVRGRWLLVTRNVHDMLQERASLFQTRRLWIDAICINQDNIKEKNSQVQLMREIYRTASRAIVWLGSPPSAALAYQFLGQIICELPLIQKINNAPLSVRPINEENPKWLALQTMFNHPYWSRVWVIQEVAVAKTVDVLYGGQYITWDVLEIIIRAFMSGEEGGLLLALDKIEGPGTVPSMGIGQAVVMANFRNKICQNEKSFLPNILLAAFKFKATDLRDRIFALQGLSTAFDERKLVPNYDISNSTQDVYIEASCYALESEDPFYLLPLAGLSYGPQMQGLPSWVTDWTKFDVQRPIRENGTPKYQASLKTSPNIEIYRETKEVHIEGAYLDYIKDVTIKKSRITATESADPNFKQEDILADQWISENTRHLEAMRMAVKLVPNLYVNGQSRPEAFWRTMIYDNSRAGRPAERKLGQDYATYIKALSMVHTPGFIKILESPCPLPESVARTIPRETLVKCQEFLGGEEFQRLGFGRFMRYIHTRQFAVTEKGYMLLVPPGTKAGDVIVIFMGAQTPYVLRGSPYNRKDDAGKPEYYELVGEAYVHGFMDGEALNGDPKHEIFRIR